MMLKLLRSGYRRLLDASILFSFDRSGYHRHSTRFEPGDLDAELAGRVCLVTGANSGIGFLVLNNQYMYRIPEMYASIVILAIIGLCVNYLLIAGERAVSSWRK